MLSSLSDYWGQVFSEKDVDRAAAFQCINRFKPAVDLSGLPPPTERDRTRFLENVTPGAPGPGQLPYFAWRFHLKGSQVLYEALSWALDGKPLLFGFNTMLGAFLAKGDEPGDEDTALRDAAATRPPGLKTTDCKIMTAVCVKPLSRPCPTSSQRPSGASPPRGISG
eukprot:639599-Pyramimonas_sp.AAC.1